MATAHVTAPPCQFGRDTPLGRFTLRLVDPGTDLDLVHRWMHAPHVVPFWQQAWPRKQVASYLADQLAGGTSRPCVGSLAGEPVSYWEIYRPVAEPVGAVYPAEPTDLGVHVLIGDAAMTGQGLGSALLAVVRDGLFAADPACQRVIAEPDVRNVASVRAFRNSGFTQVAEVSLPDKTAALMVARREEGR